ncbi:serpin family protein [Emticicia sp. 21SJ11W-3]|uniref:serpin family protein n=1 Tax=Emticicia sp. 21SJ11W-3 TaxID=2916755 RepID=UPI00209FDD8E|nr:serpin family protein [Emticicia sp. 21SJ11W-3]UTA68259.1 serpin family protein [Emticicia sp. 21SJ11W-3]
MKTLKIALLAVICSLAAASCSDKNQVSPDTEKANNQLKAIPGTFADHTSEFAFDFWKKHDASEAPDKSYFVSPLSLHIALGMLLNGADEKTKEEIQKVLRVSSDMSVTNGIYKDLIDNLPLSDPKVKNTIANSVWYRNTFNVNQSYFNNLKTYFNAGVFAENFDDSQTVGKINNWASDNTNGKIKKVIEEISPDQVLFLMNALYFKGDWKTQFKEANTQNDNFTGTKGTKSVKMMNMTENVKYAKRDSYQAIELPYGDGNYVMTVILPDKSTDATLANFSVNEWKALTGALKEQKVIVGLPRFTLEYETDLKKVLMEMGINAAFTNGADLSKIAGKAGDLKVGMVKQNTYVGVDEKGTEAAAVTTIGVVVTSLPAYPQVVCNRPFLFVISEKQSNTILFTGKISNL